MLAILLFSTVLTAFANEMKVISTSGADLVFRALLIEKSLGDSEFKCEVTQDEFGSAVKKLSASQADIVLVFDDGKLLKSLPDGISYKKFAETRLLVIVNNSNPLKLLKLSEIRDMWNEDIVRWAHFNKGNIFSIHRFGMRLDSGEFNYIRRSLGLKENAEHFPLDSSSQIIAMISGNPNAVGICAWEPDADFSKVKLVEIADSKGRPMIWKMPHIAIFRTADQARIEQFLKKSGK